MFCKVGNPLHMPSCVSLDPFKNLSLSSDSLIIRIAVGLWFNVTWISLKLGSLPLFSPFGLPVVSVFVCLLICIKSPRTSSLVFIFFSFCFSDSIIQHDLSSSLHTLSSACLNMQLNSYGEFFCLDNVLFSSRISV